METRRPSDIGPTDSVWELFAFTTILRWEQGMPWRVRLGMGNIDDSQAMGARRFVRTKHEQDM